MAAKYAGVIIDRIHPSLDKVFSYSIPEEMIDKDLLGMRVKVPFGSKLSEGYIVSIEDSVDLPVEKIKAVKEFPDPYPLLSKELIPLIKWMKEKYHCMAIEAIRCLIPYGIRTNPRAKTQKIVYLNEDIDPEDVIQFLRGRAPKMADIMTVLANEDGITVGELLEISGASSSSLNSLKAKGYVEIVKEEVYRDPWDEDYTEHTVPPVLNPEQIAAIECIQNNFNSGRTILLHGVTGSGKTEVYMRAVEMALSQGKQAIVLVPEISLTPQIVARFKGRFGEKIAVLHSRLSIGERFDEWRKIRNNEVDIVVGARSAIFAPFSRLGIIIIDESHEDTYKSGTRPRYHAREVAEKRCSLHNAFLVLGSATPSLEDYNKANLGLYSMAEMVNRVDGQPMPGVEIVDMREEIKKGNRSIFSQSMFNAVNDCLAKNEQAILLINRRGYAQFVSCRNCGYVVKCDNCDVSLTYHSDKSLLLCHYCGSSARYPQICPACGSKYIKHFGLGTQRAEQEIMSLFPKARVVRMDMDTTSRKGEHLRILSEFSSGKYNILLGTQMVAKGLDFPNVTMVGVIAADSTLNLPDYRSSEKTFQLITQVAGRAGRGQKAGRVVVQTYQPDSYAIQYASRHDYKGFFNQEINIRHQFFYPPFSNIIRILLSGEEEKELINCAHNVLQWVKEKIEQNVLLKRECIDAGVFPAPYQKIKNKYRWHVLIRILPKDKANDMYHKLIDELIERFYRVDISMSIDFNPVSLL